jgi:hypothetical protein
MDPAYWIDQLNPPAGIRFANQDESYYVLLRSSNKQKFRYTVETRLVPCLCS